MASCPARTLIQIRFTALILSAAPESRYIDTISEQFLPPSSEGECVPDSANLSSASSREPHSPSSVTPAPVETSPKIEAKPQMPAKKRRLRMVDEDADGVRIKIIPCPKEQFRRRMEETKVLGDDFYVPNKAQLMLNFCISTETD